MLSGMNLSWGDCLSAVVPVIFLIVAFRAWRKTDKNVRPGQPGAHQDGDDWPSW